MGSCIICIQKHVRIYINPHNIQYVYIVLIIIFYFLSLSFVVETSMSVFVNHGNQISEASTKSTSDGSLEPISTNTSNNQRTGEKKVTFGMTNK